MREHGRWVSWFEENERVVRDGNVVDSVVI